MGTVTGTIKHQGREIPRGLLTLLGDKGEPKSCAIINGKFESGPILTGPYKIIVLSDLPSLGGTPAPPPVANKGGSINIGEGLGAVDGKPIPKAGAKQAPKIAKKLVLDPKYGNPDTSGLSMTVVSGSNLFDADLE